MKVTIITVTLNSEKYLEDCIRSVIQQDYPDIEHIIVDGASVDGTLEIIEKYSSYIQQSISEPDKGMYDALNKGMKMATGDIIGILNSDDMLASRDVISAIVSNFNRTGVDSMYGDLVYVDPGNKQKILRSWVGKPYKPIRFKWGWMPAHPTFYFKRTIYEKLGGYETHYFSASDFEFMLRYLFKNHVSSTYLPMLIVKMRKGGQSNGSISRRLRANRRDYLAMKRNGVPFAFIVSWLKPLRKLPQYSGTIIHTFFEKSYAYHGSYTLEQFFPN